MARIISRRGASRICGYGCAFAHQLSFTSCQCEFSLVWEMVHRQNAQHSQFTWPFNVNLLSELAESSHNLVATSFQSRVKAFPLYYGQTLCTQLVWPWLVVRNYLSLSPMVSWHAYTDSGKQMVASYTNPTDPVEQSQSRPWTTCIWHLESQTLFLQSSEQDAIEE